MPRMEKMSPTFPTPWTRRPAALGAVQRVTPGGAMA
jgi:hypothetical protein